MNHIEKKKRAHNSRHTRMHRWPETRPFLASKTATFPHWNCQRWVAGFANRGCGLLPLAVKTILDGRGYISESDLMTSAAMQATFSMGKALGDRIEMRLLKRLEKSSIEVNGGVSGKLCLNPKMSDDYCAPRESHSDEGKLWMITILWLVKVSHLTFKSFKAMSIATLKLYDMLKYFPRGKTSPIFGSLYIYIYRYLFPHKMVGFIPSSFAPKNASQVFPSKPTSHKINRSPGLP